MTIDIFSRQFQAFSDNVHIYLNIVSSATNRLPLFRLKLIGIIKYNLSDVLDKIYFRYFIYVINDYVTIVHEYINIKVRKIDGICALKLSKKKGSYKRPKK